MRAARFVCALSLLTVLTAVTPSAFAATDAPDSTAIPIATATPIAAAAPATTTAAAASPDSTAAPDSTLYRINLEKGGWIDAIRIDPWAMGNLRVKTATGDVRYVSAHRVKSIKDVKGTDWRSDVVLDNRGVGSKVTDWSDRRERGPRPPDRTRRNYFVTEFGVAWGGGGDENFQRSVLSTGFGWLKNLSRDWAMGPIVQFESNFESHVEDFRLFDVGLRARRYMSDRWSFEGTLGYFEADYDRGEVHRGLPLFGEFAVTGWDAASVFIRFERHDYTFRRPIYYVGMADVDVSDVAMRVGVHLGSHPRVAALPAAVIGTLVVLSSGSPKVY